MTMQKAKELIQDLLKQYTALTIKRKPKLNWKITPAAAEKIELDYAAGTLQVEANSERNMAFALGQTLTALKSGHLGEYLGVSRPCFPLRPLFITESQPVDPKNVCLLGYNAVILEGNKERTLFQEYGIKVFAKAPQADVEGLFWESALLQPDFAPFDLTLFDAVCQELKQVEEMKKEVIFYVPSNGERQHWLSDLVDRAGPRTTIAFSAVAGEPAADHLPLHPFWETLRSSPDVSSTPLLPILNIGAVKQGECLCALPFDQLEQVLPRLERHTFAGFIGLTKHVPEELGLLHLSLWAAGQSLWHRKAPKLSAETWCLAHRPDLNFSEMSEALDKMRGIAKGVSAIRAGCEERPLADALLASLSWLDEKMKKGGFAEYYRRFAIDMRNQLKEGKFKHCKE